MSNRADPVTAHPPPPADAHASFAAAMRALIRTGLPLVEVSQEQVSRTVLISVRLLEIYRRSSEASAKNVSVLVGASMEIRQILMGLPLLYLSVLRDCLLERSKDCLPAHEAAAIAADVAHRVIELQHGARPGCGAPATAVPGHAREGREGT